MDQFAAGLNGTRSPYGTARNAFDGRFIPGGSSAGSGALVGSGVAVFAFGTDTAGSGRMPAHFNGCIGVKPTVGLVSSDGVVPACRSLDCLTVFVRNPHDGRALLDIMSGPRARNSPSYRAKGVARRWDGRTPFRFGVPQEQFLDFSGPGGPAVAHASRELFRKAIERLERLGGKRVADFDFTVFSETAQLLYGGPWVAERVAGIRAWLKQSGKNPIDDERMEPIERVIFQSGWTPSAADAFEAYAKLAVNQGRARAEWDKIDVLITPTSLHHYLVEEIEKDEKKTWPAVGAKNSNLGRFTNYMNLLDCCAIAIPSGLMTQTVDSTVRPLPGIDHEVAVVTPGGNEEQQRRYEVIKQQSAVLPWGITLVAEAWGDQYLLDVAEKWYIDSNLKVGPAGHIKSPVQKLQPYFSAVNLDVNQGKDAKLDAIVNTFSEDAVIVDQNGHSWNGRKGVHDFYSSAVSPVMHPGFHAVPDVTTAVTNGNIIAVEIVLSGPETGTIKVGDFFSFDAHGKITRLAVYKATIEEKK